MIDVSTIDRFQSLGDFVLGAIDLEVNRQAAMIAYSNDFWVMRWVTIAAAPFAFLMRNHAAGASRRSCRQSPVRGKARSTPATGPGRAYCESPPASHLFVVAR